MSYPNPGSLVSTGWLADRLDDPAVIVIDASWYMPGQGDAWQDYLDSHIPGAVFFDIDAVADESIPLPHMLPDADKFGRMVGAMGVGNDSHVVVYDRFGLVSAARVWWEFRHFGHGKASVLDGGLVKWLAEGRPVEKGEVKPAAKTFQAVANPALVRSLDQLRANLDQCREQVLDARSAGRFKGTEPEPRPNCRPGHIPGSLSLPFTDIIDPATKTVRDADALRRAFKAAGVDLNGTVVTSCGSGVTASILALGLDLLGHADYAVYDGSWSEWGARDDVPVET